MSDLIGLMISIGPAVAALMWSNLRDYRRHLADGVRADVNAAVNGVMGGESLVAIEVEPATPWRTGQVRLRAPGVYDPLLACISEAVLQRLPDDYELVTRPARLRGGASDQP